MAHRNIRLLFFDHMTDMTTVGLHPRDGHMSGFKRFLDAVTPGLLLQTVCCNAKLDIPPCSTSLHPDYVLEMVTLAELKQHMFTGSPGYSVARKQCRRRMRHQGFLLFSNKNPVPKTVAEEDRESDSGRMGLHLSLQAS